MLPCCAQPAISVLFMKSSGKFGPQTYNASSGACSPACLIISRHALPQSRQAFAHFFMCSSVGNSSHALAQLSHTVAHASQMVFAIGPLRATDLAATPQISPQSAQAAAEVEEEEEEPQPYVEGQPTIFEPNPPPAKPKRAPAARRRPPNKPAGAGGGTGRRPRGRKKPGN